jgi:hypothetical protein
MTAEIISLSARRRENTPPAEPWPRTPAQANQWLQGIAQIRAFRDLGVAFGWALPSHPREASIELAVNIMRLGVLMHEAYPVDAPAAQGRAPRKGRPKRPGAAPGLVSWPGGAAP